MEEKAIVASPAHFTKMGLFFLLHFSIFSIGVIRIAQLLASLLYESSHLTDRVSGLFNWIAALANDKFLVLSQYTITVLGLFIFYGFYFLVVRYAERNQSFTKNIDLFFAEKGSYYSYIAISLLLNFSLYLVKEMAILVPLFLVLFLAAPFCLTHVFKKVHFSTRIFLFSLLAVLCVQLFFVFAPLIFKPIYIENDYFDIPEKTILSDKTIVDNTQYINEHKIGGLHLYSPYQAFSTVSHFNKKKDDEYRLYSPEELDFISKNAIELSNQAKAAWFLFHQSYMVDPINAIALDAKMTDQTMIYGWLNILTFKKIMSLMGGINYQNYFKVFFAFYPLYYAAFLLAIYFIFREAEYVLLGALLLSSSLFLMGYELIKMAPGFNPMRHFYDVIAFALLYLYLKKSNFFALLSSLLLSLLAVAWSKDFGIFLLLSISAAAFLYEILNKNRKFYWALLVSAIGMGLTLYLLPINGKNPSFIYMLLGYSIPKTPIKFLMPMLFVFSAMYPFYISLFKKKDPIFYLSLALFFYCQANLIYFVWYPILHHLLNLAPGLILLFLTLIYLVEKYYLNWFKLNIKSLRLSVLAAAVSLYLPSALFFYTGKHQYDEIFQSHVIYKWTLNNETFNSTMDPSPFEQTIHLINKYDKQPYFYLISKYDAFLPMLVNKYNVIPYISLYLDLKSQNELNNVVNIIEKNKPAYIFIDTDILRNLDGELFDPSDTLGGIDYKNYNYKESHGRAIVLYNMRKLYVKLAGYYRPVEKSALITVYQRT